MRSSNPSSDTGHPVSSPYQSPGGRMVVPEWASGAGTKGWFRIICGTQPEYKHSVKYCGSLWEKQNTASPKIQKSDEQLEQSRKQDTSDLFHPLRKSLWESHRQVNDVSISGIHFSKYETLPIRNLVNQGSLKGAALWPEGERLPKCEEKRALRAGFHGSEPWRQPFCSTWNITNIWSLES